MFTPSWQSTESLADSMIASPWRWEFGQAIRIIQQQKLPVELKSNPSYQYPSGEISEITCDNAGWRLVCNISSMNGYNGTLPYFYQDLEQYQRLNQDNWVLHDTFAFFNDRILQLSGKVTCRSSLGIRYEIRQRQGTKLANTLLALAAVPELKTLKSTSPENLLRYSGLLGRKSTSIHNLTRILSDYFGVNISPGCPSLERVYLSDDCPTRLTSRPKRNQYNVGYLGRTAMSGMSCYLPSARANILITLDNREEFDDLFSDPSLIPAIYEICNIYFSGSSWVKLTILCPRQFLKPPRLSASSERSTASLSQSCCLCPCLKPDDYVTMYVPETSYRATSRS